MPFAIFTSSGQFHVPCGVHRVQVLAVGGGGGGGSWNGGGGGSGFVVASELPVVPGRSIPVVVGDGGRGATFKVNNRSQDAQSGGSSKFDGGLVAPGGFGPYSPCEFYVGGTGGSGGGEGCNGTCLSGGGGTGGSSGFTSSFSMVNDLSNGQGHYATKLSAFRTNFIRAGSGGNGIFNQFPGGGGGGGVLLNNIGPEGNKGSDKGALGGTGFGAGGGGGFINRSSDGLNELSHAGGNGAPGLVYIIWWSDSETVSIQPGRELVSIQPGRNLPPLLYRI